MECMSMECCARNCFQIIKDFTSRMLDFHKFPNDRDKVLEYLEILDREDLKSLPLDILRKNYFFCDLHVCIGDEKALEHRDSSRGLHRQHSDSSKEISFSHENVTQIEQSVTHEEDYYFDNVGTNAQTQHTYSHETMHNDNTGSNGADSKNSRISKDYSPENTRDRNTEKLSYFDKCTNCKLKFVSLERFRRHMFKYHRNAFCADCNKRFKSSYYLSTHKKEHCFGTDRSHHWLSK